MAKGMCYLSATAWREIHEEYTHAKRLFACIELDTKIAYCPLGHPIAINDDEYSGEQTLFVSPEVIGRLEGSGVGDNVKVLWLSEEAFPSATKIVLRPHDSAFYHVDAKEELEREFTRRGVLEEGQTISVALEALGGYEVLFDIVKTEPANIVLAEGEEVAIEFEEALDALATLATASAPEALSPLEAPSEDFEQVLPTLGPGLEDAEVQPQPPGQKLGGEIRYLPDGRRWNPWRDGAFANV